MISIKKSVTELDRLEDLRQATAACYGLALRSTAQYAIEVDPAQTEGFRRNLEALQEQSQAAAAVEEIQAVQASFRGELREYRDKVREQIGRLRKEIETATTAVQTLAETVTASGADHEVEVKSQLTRLETAAASDDVRRIREGIRAATAGITTSFEQMRRSNHFMIAQLQDEIRLLHQEMETERRALFTDPSSTAWNRQKLEQRIDQLVRQNQPFCVLLVCVRNLKRLRSQHPDSVIDSLCRALVRRFQGLVGEEAMVGRWADNAFAAILDIDPAGTITLSREAANKLSGPYAIQDRGQSISLALQAAAGVVDLQAAGDPAHFHQNLTQLASALLGS